MNRHVEESQEAKHAITQYFHNKNEYIPTDQNKDL